MYKYSLFESQKYKKINSFTMSLLKLELFLYKTCLNMCYMTLLLIVWTNIEYVYVIYLAFYYSFKN